MKGCLDSPNGDGVKKLVGYYARVKLLERSRMREHETYVNATERLEAGETRGREGKRKKEGKEGGREIHDFTRAESCIGEYKASARRI